MVHLSPLRVTFVVKFEEKNFPLPGALMPVTWQSSNRNPSWHMARLFEGLEMGDRWGTYGGPDWGLVLIPFALDLSIHRPISVEHSWL